MGLNHQVILHLGIDVTVILPHLTVVAILRKVSESESKGCEELKNCVHGDASNT